MPLSEVLLRVIAPRVGEVNDWKDEDLPKRTRPGAGMCPHDCACQVEDAMTTPLDLEDIE